MAGIKLTQNWFLLVFVIILVVYPFLLSTCINGDDKSREILGELIEIRRLLSERSIRLTAVLESLDTRVDELTLAQASSRGTSSPSPLQDGILQENLDVLKRIASLLVEIEHMGQVIDQTSVLNPDLSGLATETPEGISQFASRWSDETSAGNDLFMMTYGQVMERLGSPLSFHGQNKVVWEYEDGFVNFVDGYASSVTFKKTR